MSGKVVQLPRDFIGTEDEHRLESFGSHLIGHGCATRWHWNRENGIDVAFEIFRGGAEEALVFVIKRNRDKGAFYVTDAMGNRLEEGKLDHVMAFIDEMAKATRPDAPA